MHLCNARCITLFSFSAKHFVFLIEKPLKLTWCVCTHFPTIFHSEMQTPTNFHKKRNWSSLVIKNLLVSFYIFPFSSAALYFPFYLFIPSMDRLVSKSKKLIPYFQVGSLRVMESAIIFQYLKAIVSQSSSYKKMVELLLAKSNTSVQLPSNIIQMSIVASVCSSVYANLAIRNNRFYRQKFIIERHTKIFSLLYQFQTGSISLEIYFNCE